MIAAGELVHRVEIQRLTETPDAYGAPRHTWRTVATVWASIEDGQGRELFRAQQVKPEITAVVKIRWFEGLTAKDRFKWGPRTLNIDGVSEGKRRRVEMVCQCVEER